MSKTLLTAIIVALTALLTAFKAELKGASEAPAKSKGKAKPADDDDDDEETEEGEGTEESPKIVKGKGTSGKLAASKAKGKKKPEPEEEDEDEDEDEEEEDEEEEDDGLTLADLRKQAKPIIKAGHSDEVKELLESFDADSLTTLDEDNYEAFSKKLAKLGKKLGV